MITNEELLDILRQSDFNTIHLAMQGIAWSRLEEPIRTQIIEHTMKKHGWTLERYNNARQK